MLRLLLCVCAYICAHALLRYERAMCMELGGPIYCEAMTDDVDGKLSESRQACSFSDWNHPIAGSKISSED